MSNKYIDWIDRHYPDREAAKNKCHSAVQTITTAFPELKVQVGRANGIFHCWAKDEKGEIVDPTAKQFDGEIKYSLIAERFLKKHEIEPATGAIFLDPDVDTGA